jgi:transcriptional regulator with XRE-family HTH domain
VTRIDVGGLGEYIREQRKLAEMSLRQLAANAEISNPYLSQIERGMRKPSAEILSQIAKGLRISAETLYVRAGILEDIRGDGTVTAALLADQTITDRQRQVLQEIYAAFQAENAATDSTRAGESDKNSPDSVTEGLGRTTVGSKTPESSGGTVDPGAQGDHKDNALAASGA